MAENHCQQCSLCCRLLGIISLEKMPGTWCTYCKPGRGGCQIHDNPLMPTECADYVCLWLQCRQEGNPLPDHLRPDRSKVIIDARLDEHAHNVRCDPLHPNAWRDPEIQRLLASLAATGSTIYLITPTGEEHRLAVVGIAGR